MHNDKYKGKFRNETTRLRSWDYAADAWYFITICTHNRAHFFGKIVNDAMQLSSIGEVAACEWVKTAELRPYAELDAWVIMPNHLHGIVIINREGMQVDSTREPSSTVGTRCFASLPPTSTAHPSAAQNQFGPLKKDSLQSIIRGYKSAVTTWCKKNGYADFAWQPRYYEHVIRSEDALRKIREYIENNPLKWALDNENAPGAWM